MLVFVMVFISTGLGTLLVYKLLHLLVVAVEIAVSQNLAST